MADPEAEVRSSICKNLVKLIPLLEVDFVQSKLLAEMEQLLQDENPFTRSSLACCIGALASRLNHNATLVERISNFLNILLRDSSTEVRLNALKSVSKNVKDFSSLTSLSTSLIYAIVQLSNDASWRIRIEVPRLAPILSKRLGLDVFQGALSSILLQALIDRSFAVRREAAQMLSECADLFGIKWVMENFISPTLTYSKHSNHLVRQASLFALQAVISFCTKEMIEEYYLPTLCILVDDPVPNIRYCLIQIVVDLKNLSTLSSLEAKSRHDDAIDETLGKIEGNLLSDSHPIVKAEAKKILRRSDSDNKDTQG